MVLSLVASVVVLEELSFAGMKELPTGNHRVRRVTEFPVFLLPMGPRVRKLGHLVMLKLFYGEKINTSNTNHHYSKFIFVHNSSLLFFFLSPVSP